VEGFFANLKDLRFEELEKNGGILRGPWWDVFIIRPVVNVVCREPLSSIVIFRKEFRPLKLTFGIRGIPRVRLCFFKELRT